MSRFSLRLHNPVQAHQALDAAWSHINGWLVAGGGRLVLEVRPETRSDLQNRMLHACFGDVAKQSKWMDRKLTADQWKLLFVSGHSIATKEGAEMVTGLEGEFLNIRESTARMSKARMASLLDYVTAWAVTNGVRLQDGQQFIDQETGEITNGS